ncbi:hypothetical protein BDV97DRAFT_293934 [Delphinella strobiligena]|nr:hypothetical protein BDV97DRAFT_293934 [Delphinella strobiligena]
MPLHLGLPIGHQHESTREARRMLQQKTRNDWDYPSAPHPNTPAANGDAKAAPAGWRERAYSDIETTESEAEDSSNVIMNMIKSKRRPPPPPPVDPDTLAERKQKSMRRRQERFEDEMTWNIGLAHFSAQRNAWTAARTRPSTPPPTLQVRTKDAGVHLPIAPRLLPDHPVRARITSSTYSEIYTKVIIGGRTPTVPINLQDCTNALVHGWKEEGNWPPKTTDAEPSVTRKKEGNTATSTATATGSPGRHPHLRAGVHAVTKVLRGVTGGPPDSNMQ